MNINNVPYLTQKSQSNTSNANTTVNISFRIIHNSS